MEKHRPEDEFKFCTVETGAQCVVMARTCNMLMSFAISWDTKALKRQLIVNSLPSNVGGNRFG